MTVRLRVVQRIPTATLPTMTMMQPIELAEAVRAACLRTLRQAYEDAGLQGLCDDGRMEAAVGALQALDLSELVHEMIDRGSS